jgi:hypothetical protein
VQEESLQLLLERSIQHITVHALPRATQETPFLRAIVTYYTHARASIRIHITKSKYDI